MRIIIEVVDNSLDRSTIKQYMDCILIDEEHTKSIKFEKDTE